ncbi:MAG: hypothetical protein IKB01_12730 [Lachnospiraceae bacterium]|nr:hypothetical protein [Lachnospiraceae bacterium]
MDWALKDKIGEARWYVGAIKDVCQVMETPCVVDIPKSVFLTMEVLCERILSLLPEPDEEV